MDRFWLTSYHPAVPHAVGPAQYRALGQVFVKPYITYSILCF